jgi:hypothetical protein
MSKISKIFLIAIMAASVSTFVSMANAAEWTSLFNGKDIKGWEKKGGKASYKVEDDCIVGTTKPNTPNTFLCPPKSYSDFELTFEVKCDPALNSGVQIRSISSADEIPAGLSEKDAAKARRELTENRFSGRRWKSLQTAMPLVFGSKVSVAGCWRRNLKSPIKPTKKTAGTNIEFSRRVRRSRCGSTAH